MRVSVVDYGSGNIASAARALAEAAERHAIRAAIEVTSDPRVVATADRIVLPGQGAFADCAEGLSRHGDLARAITDRVEAGAAFLGICVGMQLMAERGLEHRATPGFGWIRGEIAPMAAPGLRLPQMGWNELVLAQPDHPLVAGIGPGDHGYFVHSYALRDYEPADIIATADYGGAVPALVARGRRCGTQFHVEKSQHVGLTILANFLRWSA